jgi:hypothetical protein
MLKRNYIFRDVHEYKNLNTTVSDSRITDVGYIVGLTRRRRYTFKEGS